MKFITKDSCYAMQALCYLAKKDNEKVAVSELAEALDIPRAFLRKILQTLSNHNLLISYKGTGGGFQLKKKPADIYLLDVMEIFQGPLEFHNYLVGDKVCPHIKACKVKKKIDDINTYALSKLQGVSLKELIKD